MLLKYRPQIVWLLFGCIVLVFFGLRIPSLLRHDVAYTYDQARDLLLGARLIIDRHLVFIGPTTGIGGLFHGAWWYYVTALSYLVLGSDPIRAYIAVFAVHLLSLVVAFVVLRQLLGGIIALTFAMLVAGGDYFIGHSLFIGNNIMAMPAYLGVILSICWLYLKSPAQNTPHTLYAIRYTLYAICFFGLSLGFVAEFELAFGLFLIPSIGLLFFVPSFRRLFTSLAAYAVFIGSISVAFVPRILFEVKNHFIQTSVLLSFVTEPKYYTPKPLIEVLHERLANFSSFLTQAFTHPYLLLCITVLAGIVLISTLYHLGKKKPTRQVEQLFLVLCLLHSLLFVLSLGYKDTFWGYYFEGIQYGFVITGLVAMHIYQRQHPKYIAYFCILVSIFFVITSIPRMYSVWTETPTSAAGLKIQEDVVDHVISREGKNDYFCLRVYVPPVIPYTYDYLWLHHYVHKNIRGTPRQDYIDDRCWYIIEPDQPGYEFRPLEWRKRNIPSGAIRDENETRLIHGIEVSRYHLAL